MRRNLLGCSSLCLKPKNSRYENEIKRVRQYKKWRTLEIKYQGVSGVVFHTGVVMVSYRRHI